MSKRRVLFLCTGNSARSQMAQGLVNHFLSDRWEAFSAGTQPAGYVHPLAIQAMDELGIDISDQRSKSVDAFRDLTFDQVIIVCDNSAKNCPVWLGAGQTRHHMGLPDPARASGSEVERLKAFRHTRDNLREKALRHLQEADNVVYREELCQEKALIES